MTKHAFRYLERIAEGDHVIAALQEWPWEFPDLSNHILRCVPVGDKSKILYSSSLELRDCSLDSSGRATIARFRLPAGNELTCVGLHWYHRDNQTGIGDPYERGGAMALFRHHLEDTLGTDRPAVVMGDFNASAQEHEREIASRYCLFALSARHRVTPKMETVMGRTKRPWLLVEPEVPQHLGTFYWQRTKAWSILDHVVLTPELAKGLRGAEVLTEMEGHNFITPDKRLPRGESLASDHLPVICRIHYQ